MKRTCLICGKEFDGCEIQDICEECMRTEINSVEGWYNDLLSREREAEKPVFTPDLPQSIHKPKSKSTSASPRKGNGGGKDAQNTQ